MDLARCLQWTASRAYTDAYLVRCHASYYTQMVKSLHRRRLTPQCLNPSSDNHNGSYDLPGESAGTMVDALLQGSVTCVDNFLGTSGGHPLGNRTRPKTSSKNMQTCFAKSLLGPSTWQLRGFELEKGKIRLSNKWNRKAPCTQASSSHICDWAHDLVVQASSLGSRPTKFSK